MKSATVYMSVNVNGDNVASNIGPNPLTTILTSSPVQHTTTAVVSGNITVQVPQLPSPAQYCLILPPNPSSVQKYVMSSSDTVGFQLNPSLPSLISVGAISSFVLRASGSENVEIWFF